MQTCRKFQRQKTWSLCLTQRCYAMSVHETLNHTLFPFNNFTVTSHRTFFWNKLGIDCASKAIVQSSRASSGSSNKSRRCARLAQIWDTAVFNGSKSWIYVVMKQSVRWYKTKLEHGVERVSPEKLASATFWRSWELTSQPKKKGHTQCKITEKHTSFNILQPNPRSPPQYLETDQWLSNQSQDHGCSIQLHLPYPIRGVWSLVIQHPLTRKWLVLLETCLMDGSPPPSALHCPCLSKPKWSLGCSWHECWEKHWWKDENKELALEWLV